MHLNNIGQVFIIIAKVTKAETRKLTVTILTNSPALPENARGGSKSDHVVSVMRFTGTMKACVPDPSSVFVWEERWQRRIDFCDKKDHQALRKATKTQIHAQMQQACMTKDKHITSAQCFCGFMYKAYFIHS